MNFLLILLALVFIHHSSFCIHHFFLLIHRSCHNFVINSQPSPNLLHRNALVGRVLGILHLSGDLNRNEAIAIDAQFAIHLAFGVATTQSRRN
jgi:hypothetical protein